MAVRYVRSTDGNNADSGATWALAKVDLAGVAAIDTAGDTIWVSDNHAESTAAAISFGWAGSQASPIMILCGDDSAEPPTALATTATVTTTGDNSITWGSAGTQYTYTYGITFTAGSGASGTASIICNGAHVFESCNFILGSTGTSSVVQMQFRANRFVNCGFKFGAADQGIDYAVSTAGHIAQFIGCSLLSGGTSPTTLFKFGVGTWEIDGFDLTNANAAINLFSSTSQNIRAVVRNCKLPASWSGSLHSGTPGTRSVIEMFNCDSGDTNYRYRKAAEFGTIQDETTLVRTGGASDGTTGISWKMVTNANAEFPMLTLDTPEIVRWNDTTGSAITVTVHGLWDSATNIKDNEIWLDVMYLGTSGVPLGSFVNDGISVVATAADQAASTETWTTTGMANPNKFKLVVTFTPAEKGFLHCVVKQAKASATTYIDPVLNIS